VAMRWGQGTTILAILAMHLARDEPGCFSLVVCPKSCQPQWEAETESSYAMVSLCFKKTVSQSAELLCICHNN
jgi:hypothetical protein